MKTDISQMPLAGVEPVTANGRGGHRATAFATKRVPLVGDYWADVRPVTGEQQIAVAQALTGGPVTSINYNTKYELNSNAHVASALAAFIVNWNVDDESHVIFPINEYTVMKELNAYEQSVLMAEYRRMNTPLVDEAVLSERKSPLP